MPRRLPVHHDDDPLNLRFPRGNCMPAESPVESAGGGYLAQFWPS